MVVLSLGTGGTPGESGYAARTLHQVAHGSPASAGVGRVAVAASLGLCVLGGMAAPADASRHHTEQNAQASKPKPEPPKQPSGPLLLSVSVSGQRVTVYDNATPIASSQVSTGMPGHATPMGIFSIIQKQRWHHSNLYSNAPMPYMQRITWSGVALHAGVVPGYPASHGCIRLPAGFATRLYGMTKVGARVIVARGNVAPFEIDHPRLASLVKPPEAKPPEDAKDTKSDGAALSTPASAVVVATTGAVSTGESGQSQPENGAPAASTESGSQAPSAGDQPAPNPAPPPPKGEDILQRPGQLSLFISRRERKLFVRKGFTPAFDVPITIAESDRPLGNHIFTASRTEDGGLRWFGVSLGVDRQASGGGSGKKGKHKGRVEPATAAAESPRQAAASALDRIELPPEALARITPLVTQGTSLTISDQGLGGETGKDTDFIVVTK